MKNSFNTAQHPFGDCSGNQQQPFNVNDGIPVDDALVNISQLLKCASETAYELSDCGLPQRGLIGATLHCIDSAKALVDALLNGLAIIDRNQGSVGEAPDSGVWAYRPDRGPGGCGSGFYPRSRHRSVSGSSRCSFRG